MQRSLFASLVVLAALLASGSCFRLGATRGKAGLHRPALSFQRAPLGTPCRGAGGAPATARGASLGAVGSLQRRRPLARVGRLLSEVSQRLRRCALGVAVALSVALGGARGAFAKGGMAVVPGADPIMQTYRTPTPSVLDGMSLEEQMDMEMDFYDLQVKDKGERTLVVTAGAFVLIWFGSGIVARQVQNWNKRRRYEDRMKEIELTGMYIGTDATPMEDMDPDAGKQPEEADLPELIVPPKDEDGNSPDAPSASAKSDGGGGKKKKKKGDGKPKKDIPEDDEDLL